jgi:hypothetical protein
VVQIKDFGALADRALVAGHHGEQHLFDRAVEVVVADLVNRHPAQPFEPIHVSFEERFLAPKVRLHHQKPPFAVHGLGLCGLVLALCFGLAPLTAVVRRAPEPVN